MRNLGWQEETGSAEYDKYGEEAFTNKIRNKQYSKDFKVEMVIKRIF